jgi:hypothetical protein
MQSIGTQSELVHGAEMWVIFCQRYDARSERDDDPAKFRNLQGWLAVLAWEKCVTSLCSSIVAALPFLSPCYECPRSIIVL